MISTLSAILNVFNCKFSTMVLSNFILMWYSFQCVGYRILVTYMQLRWKWLYLGRATLVLREKIDHLIHSRVRPCSCVKLNTLYFLILLNKISDLGDHRFCKETIPSLKDLNMLFMLVLRLFKVLENSFALFFQLMILVCVH